jgi:hypothetical protein
MNTSTVIDIVNTVCGEKLSTKTDVWAGTWAAPIRNLYIKARGDVGEALAIACLKTTEDPVFRDETIEGSSCNQPVDAEGLCKYEIKFSSSERNRFWFNQIRPQNPWETLIFVFAHPDRLEVWAAKRSQELEATFKDNNNWTWMGKPQDLPADIWTCLVNVCMNQTTGVIHE